ncbi:putative MobA-like protein [Mycolicibacterium tokaiense]|uniref:Putative MobA-like protein n=1 Tax=Mycolicibacterium tokaiense TaxID=39695 RepID=A0A378TAF7_9MYCO|nr:NTP transferase domain-containing protein [Mycolicibacterium tokaiense]STZ57771.1 putative MobA-like protein [Mycolicibacterium tokaiense]
MSSDARVTGVVLAAGAGTRFGMPKVLAAQGAWLRQAISALAGAAATTWWWFWGGGGGRARSGPCGTGAGLVRRHECLAAGRSGRCGRGPGVVLHLVDTPDVGADVVRRVLASDAELARAVYRGRPGHPVYIGAAHWPALVAGLVGDQGARAFLSGRQDVVTVECGDLATGADIDTPEAMR